MRSARSSGLETSSVTIDGIAFKWVASDALTLKLDPATLDFGAFTLTSGTIQSVPIIAPPTLRYVAKNYGSPKAVWSWIRDLLAGGGLGGRVQNRVGVVGASLARDGGDFTEVDINFEKAPRDGSRDTDLGESPIFGEDLAGIAGLASITELFLRILLVAVKKTGVVGWLKRSTPVSIGEDVSLEALDTFTAELSDTTIEGVGVDGSDGSGEG